MYSGGESTELLQSFHSFIIQVQLLGKSQGLDAVNAKLLVSSKLSFQKEEFLQAESRHTQQAPFQLKSQDFSLTAGVKATPLIFDASKEFAIRRQVSFKNRVPAGLDNQL